MWGIIQITKLVNFPWPTPTPETHPTPCIMPMTSCDITWHHRCDVALPTWHYWTLILLIHPCMTHPTPAWSTPPLHDPPHPCMTHPKPPWPTPPLHHSIVLSFTCHSLRNFPPLINIPLYPFMNFQNPMSYYFSSLSHL